MTHFLQSTAWEVFQKSLGRKTFRDQGDGWSYLAILEHGTGNTRLYVPYGPEFRDEKALSKALDSLTKLGCDQGVTFVRIEPISGSPSLEKKHGYQSVSYQQLNPTRTQLLDLSPSKEEVLAQMSQNSRNITRNYTKKGIRIQQSYRPEDITILTKLLKDVARRNNITPHSADYFEKQAEILFPLKAASLYYATLDGKPIAAALIYDSDTTRYYAHAASDDSYRKLAAGTALVGQMILDAKDKGLQWFDLYGIAPENEPRHPWTGFTKFKQSFGGNPVEYGGTWELPIESFSYWFYRTYQTLRRIVR